MKCLNILYNNKLERELILEKVDKKFVITLREMRPNSKGRIWITVDRTYMTELHNQLTAYSWETLTCQEFLKI
jgi:hypothetical protein